ncbi:CmpA/NrtA family ABC transporter substrate-binding protein [Alteromonas sp. ASW11-36]|uniref:CmpA/NrtA family ABC transporter substrate-binding protein n=1 Tax=Alteromonas arenosi TaxID=3055817 RepID=A0ABT7SWD2_9ALTE|nr:CmpA/NrtA family ABC transporter substrate-binding protein [Alteromonas sp. ASW11-36]MDM7860460.1 CmpA/NrtA family ABC transporter substrate-binding protein [Alteromonas sp. ASW11-36]
MSLQATVGYIPLTDCAPLVIAKELGFFQQYGVNVDLQAQRSWATLREKLHAGVLDAAQVLAPLPFASQLGLDTVATDVIAPMVLSLNGNAITLSNYLCTEIKSANSIKDINLPMAAYLLEKVITRRKRKGASKLRFASVFPYSCHFYQLCEWLKSGGVSMSDVDLTIVTSDSMISALHNGEIDGYCAGGPWNAKAVRAGLGTTVLTSYDIWRESPEKVLGLLGSFYRHNPATVYAICRGLKQACQWLASIPNRFEAACILSQSKYLDAPIEVVAPSLLGSCLIDLKHSPREVPDYNQFHSKFVDINSPTQSSRDWLLQQMLTTGQVSQAQVDSLKVGQVFRADIYAEAMLGL